MQSGVQGNQSTFRRTGEVFSCTVWADKAGKRVKRGTTDGFEFWFSSPSCNGFTESNDGAFEWLCRIRPGQVLHVGREVLSGFGDITKLDNGLREEQGG